MHWWYVNNSKFVRADIICMPTYFQYNNMWSHRSVTKSGSVWFSCISSHRHQYNKLKYEILLQMTFTPPPPPPHILFTATITILFFILGRIIQRLDTWNNNGVFVYLYNNSYISTPVCFGEYLWMFSFLNFLVYRISNEI